VRFLGTALPPDSFMFAVTNQRGTRRKFEMGVLKARSHRRNPPDAHTIAHFRRHGFGYMGLRFIATDVVRENNATYRLTYKELRKDSTKMGSGSPEFLLLFFKLPTDRSNGYADEPVTKDADAYTLARWQIDADALWRSSGDRWTDIARMRTLNGEQSRRGLENHICPLQFDIVDRAIRLYSNPGDLVLDPFAGLGTVPMRAVALGRPGTAIELNEDYWRQAVRYCGEAASERAVPGLFDFLDAEAAA
jgi:hypothetical protein